MIKLEKCPERETLLDFLLGKLDSEEIESCQQHLAGCDPCVDTIRGLDVEGDTFDNLAREALVQAANTEEQTESRVVNGLIEKMQRLSDSGGLLTSNYVSDPAHDRAAEIERLLDPPVQEDEPGVLGRYRLTSLLGAGSTGVVYQAIDRQLERTVALKILRPSLGPAARVRFVAEARATAAIEHSNVVTIYDVGEEGPLAYIAMQWVPGETLDRMLDSCESIPAPNAKKLGLQIAEGLVAAHSRGLIHRDIKPANVWMPADGSGAKILDFGLVRITDENPQLTCTGMIAGTPCYMSPEQSRGQNLDCRSDLFSLGCLLYLSLTGRLPFRGDNALATLQSIQRDHPTPPSELDPSIPDGLSDLVMCLLEKSPGRRPPSAEDVIHALTSERGEWKFDVDRYESGSETEKLDTLRSLKKSKSSWKSIGAMAAGVLMAITGLVYAQQITRIVTNQGEIVIDSQVDDVQIEVLENGQRIDVIDLATQKSITVRAGEYEIRELGEQNSVSIDHNVLTLSRGGKSIVTVTRNLNRTPSAQNADTPFALPPYSGAVNRDAIADLDPGFPTVWTWKDAEGNIYHSNGGVPADAQDVRVIPVPGLQRPIANKPVSGTSEPYLLDSGDVLGVFVDGVLGVWDESPPVYFPAPESGLPPSTGFPVLVDEKGLLSLPMIEAIDVRGKTVTEIQESVDRSYKSGDLPILRPEARVMLSLMRPRHYVPPAASTASDNADSSVQSAQTKIFQLEVELNEMNRKFGDQHPKVLAVKQQIESWKEYLHQLDPADSFPGNSQETTGTKPVAVFDGKTFEEFLEIARTERSLEKLNPAIRGLAQLANEEQLQEVLAVVMKVMHRGTDYENNVNRTEFNSLARNIFKGLTIENATQLIENELDNGNELGRNQIPELMNNIDMNEVFRSSDAAPYRSRIVRGLRDYVVRNESVEAIRFAYSFLGSMQQYSNGNPTDDPEAKEIVRLYYDRNFTDASTFSDSIRLVIQVSPETPGLADKFREAYEKTDLERLFRGDYSNFESTGLLNNNTAYDFFELTQLFPDEQMEQILPAVIKFWQTKKSSVYNDIEDRLLNLFESSPQASQGLLNELAEMREQQNETFVLEEGGGWADGQHPLVKRMDALIEKIKELKSSDQ